MGRGGPSSVSNDVQHGPRKAFSVSQTAACFITLSTVASRVDIADLAAAMSREYINALAYLAQLLAGE